MAKQSTAPWRDLKTPGNSSHHLTGKICIESDCIEPAGTAWSPLWCTAHNIERLDRINEKFSKLETALARPASKQEGG